MLNSDVTFEVRVTNLSRNSLQERIIVGYGVVSYVDREARPPKFIIRMESGTAAVTRELNPKGGFFNWRYRWEDTSGKKILGWLKFIEN